MMKSLLMVGWVMLGVTTLVRAELEVEEREETIVLLDQKNELVMYHKAEVDPPEGVDLVYRRSGFLHPVKTPKGREVTGIHPSDHYHHLGLWHAWVKTNYHGEEIDFWNLKKGVGRVRYAETIELISEDGAAGFVVKQEHVAYLGETKKETIVLEETFRVRARKVDGAYEIDYVTEQKHVGEHVLELPAYRYGGPIAYRAPHDWDKTNSDYLSSEGKTRIDGHQTRSRWCAFSGPSQDGEGAISLAILSHEQNHDAPQRMRVWPPKSNNGAIFFNYVPIQEHPWALEPGDVSAMKYRLVVKDAAADPADLNPRWERFVGE
ncbi:MAG: PmoA family protein [Verrucomicrobiota bacterium]